MSWADNNRNCNTFFFSKRPTNPVFPHLFSSILFGIRNLNISFLHFLLAIKGNTIQSRERKQTHKHTDQIGLKPSIILPTHRIRKEPFWLFKKTQSKIYKNTLESQIGSLESVLATTLWQSHNYIFNKKLK